MREQIVSEAERVAGGDLKVASDLMRALMDRWKAAPTAGKPANDRLWARFEKAKDHLRSRREEQKREWQRQQYERLFQWKQQRDQLSVRISEMDHRAADIRARYIRPGPHAYEIASRNDVKAGSIERKAMELRTRLSDLDRRIYDLTSRLH
jgi:hypothetical protein